MGRNRLRTYALLASVALLSTLVVVPAFGDDHLTDADAVEFTAVDGPARFEYGDLEQVLGFERNTCAIADPAGGSTETLLNLSSTGGAPGLNDSSIGVRSNGRNANGTPCSQIDGAESLTITPGNQLPGVRFSAVRLDLEMTGNATVVVTFSDADGPVADAFVLYTGTTAVAACTADPGLEGCNGTGPADGPYVVMSASDDPVAACASPSNSGPNSHASDNCIWTVEPGADFDAITLTVEDVGTVSLEGGSDTGADNTSLFYLAPDRLFCGEPITFGEGTDEPLYTVLALNGVDELTGEPIPCEKGYTYSADLGSGTGDPSVTLITEGDDEVVFLERLEFRSQAVTWNGQLPSLYYDDDLDVLDETLAQFCLTDPRAVENGEPVFNLHEDYDSALEADNVLPGTETTCIITADFATTGDDGPLVQAVYYLYNLNDGFRTFR